VSIDQNELKRGWVMQAPLPRPRPFFTSDCWDFVKVAAVTGVLGFLTTCASSGFLALGVKSQLGCYVLGVFMLCSAVSIVIVCLCMKLDRIYMNVLLGTSVICLVCCALCFGTKSNYHMDANYLNRVTVYLFMVLGPAFVLTLMWPGLVHLLISSIAGAAVRSEETFLYFTGSGITGFLVALVSGAASGSTLSKRATWIFWHSLGIWFVGGFIAAIVGILLRRSLYAVPELERSDFMATAKPSIGYDTI
jgi:hypothetical protein